MRLATLVLLLVLTLTGLPVGCSGTGGRPVVPVPPNTPSQRQDVFPFNDDFTWVESVRSSVCKVWVDGGHGSGFAVERQGPWTIVLTAAHVAEDINVEGGAVVEYIKGGYLHQEIARFVTKHTDYDVAVLRIKDSGLSLLPLAVGWTPVFDPSTRTYGPNYVVGCPKDLFPPVITTGFITMIFEERIGGTAGGWFGNSGGAMLNADRKVIGVVCWIYGQDDPMSNQIAAVGLEAIREVLVQYYILYPEENDARR